MPTKTIQIDPTPKFIPTHTRGDKDFHGHGPQVNVSAWLRIVNQNQLWVRLWMRAKETKSDWTTAEGSVDYFVYNGAYEGVGRITRLISDPYSYNSYTDTNHSDDTLTLPPYELIDKFIVTGDTYGNEAGTKTGVTAYFNPIEFEYEPLIPPEHIKTISDLDPTPKFIPPHVGGDKDFKGHGPNVDVTTSISIENENEIWARVWMRAIETKSDWTEASGSTRYLIYRNENKILQILSDTQSSAHYRDYNHQQDRLNLPATELVRQFIITGDTRGNEAGTKTGVVAVFNPITFREEGV